MIKDIKDDFVMSDDHIQIYILMRTSGGILPFLIRQGHTFTFTDQYLNHSR